MLADAAQFEAALATAVAPAKAAVFVSKESLAPLLLHAQVVEAAQVAAGGEARVKLGGKKAVSHVAVHALSEEALDRSLCALLALMAERSGEGLELEVRWLLRRPAESPAELLRRWRAAVRAFLARFPMRLLEASLLDDHSCLCLRLGSDGWEEWGGTEGEGVQGAAVAPFAVAWLLAHARFGLVPRAHCADVTQAHAAVLLHEQHRGGGQQHRGGSLGKGHKGGAAAAAGGPWPGREQSARLRALAAESGAVVLLMRAGAAAAAGQRAGKGESADDDDDEEVVAAEAAAAGGAGGGGAPPRWVICGARSAVKRARVLLAACDAHVVERLGGASIQPLRYIEPASVPVGS